MHRKRQIRRFSTALILLLLLAVVAAALIRGLRMPTGEEEHHTDHEHTLFVPDSESGLKRIFVSGSDMIIQRRVNSTQKIDFSLFISDIGKISQGIDPVSGGKSIDT